MAQLLAYLIAITTLVAPGLSAEDGKSYISYPESRFIVLTDLHYFDSSLGTSGAAFQKYLDSDRKLLAESTELLDAAIDEISDIPADFVIICGDLTKDGERTNHELLAKKLKVLVKSGKQVFVTPGNHDINNFDSYRFEGDRPISIPTVKAYEFADLYKEYGYGQALKRDPYSLSYVVEPVRGLWLLSMDSNKWKENQPGKHPKTSGVFYDGTVNWLKDLLEEAQNRKKAVVMFLHHGIMEHYPSNEKHYDEYILDNHEKISELLARYHVQLAFSGHFHAQDITVKRFDELNRSIFDIETGSLVTAPCPYRIVTITKDQKAKIESRFIRSIASRPEGFVEFSNNYVFEGTMKLADEALQGYKVGEEDRKIINPQIAKAYATHLRGDEILPSDLYDNDGVGYWGRFIIFMQADLIEGWYTDLPPKDNNLTINLLTGDWED